MSSQVKKLAVFGLDKEPIGVIKRLKKRVLKDFSMHKQKTQLALSRLVNYLYIFRREKELKEIIEYMLSMNDREEESPNISHLYKFYPYYLMLPNTLQAPSYLKVCKQKIASYKPYSENIFKIHEKIIELNREDKNLVLERNLVILSTLVYELALGGRSNFSREELLLKHKKVLSWLQKYYKIEA